MKRFFMLASLCAAVVTVSCSPKAESANAGSDKVEDTVPVVYYTKDISPESLVKIYNALGRKAEGNNVGVKISTGESNKSNQLAPGLIAGLVKSVDGTLIECNTAYGGNRSTTEDHLRAAKEHGYMDIADVDIMDADGDTALAVNGGKHLPYDLVGKHFLNYDFIVVLSHFKGHAMGGFGGALKNISIGIASAEGKAWIHSAGKVSDPAQLWDNLPAQDDFIESMAEACKAVIDHIGDNILYINVANNLSVDCDCDGNPAAPEIGDLGILASLDPVALDKACVDMVFDLNDSKKEALVERINSRHGTHILEYAEQLGIGTRKYKLVTIQ